jgi:signal transduction histidine kinase
VSIFDDLAALPDTAPIVPMLRAEGLRSYVIIRLGIGDQIIGAMNLAAQQAGAFHREQIEVAREVAVQLAIAIHQAQLREQIQRHATELEQRVAERTRELAAANERLTELDRLKSKFVSDVSHELRTPITSLKLYLELLEHGKPEKKPRYLIGLNEQADRMAQLIEDILDLSRLERDKATLIFAPIDLNAVVENVVIGQQARADQAGLALTFDLDPHLPAVSGEIHRLTQVVTNLVVNAVNYTPHGEVRLASFVKDDDVCLEVRDTGMGIDAADQTHLFERFYRGKRAVQSSVRGTGLGLSIVKDIVELHGGHMEVESRVNAGSTFRVWLPIAN